MKKFHHTEFLFGACCCFFSSTHIISTKQQRLKWSRSSDPKAEHMHQYFTTTYFQIEKNETQKRKILKPNQKYVTHRQHSAAGRSLLLSEVSAGQAELRPYFQKSWNNFRAQTAISAGQAQPMYLNTYFFSHVFSLPWEKSCFHPPRTGAAWPPASPLPSGRHGSHYTRPSLCLLLSARHSLQTLGLTAARFQKDKITCVSYLEELTSPASAHLAGLHGSGGQLLGPSPPTALAPGADEALWHRCAGPGLWLPPTLWGRQGGKPCEGWRAKTHVLSKEHTWNEVTVICNYGER